VGKFSTRCQGQDEGGPGLQATKGTDSGRGGGLSRKRGSTRLHGSGGGSPTTGKEKYGEVIS